MLKTDLKNEKLNEYFILCLTKLHKMNKACREKNGEFVWVGKWVRK